MKRSIQVILVASSIGGALAAACIGADPDPLPAIPSGDAGEPDQVVRGAGDASPADAGVPATIPGLALWLDGDDPASVEFVGPADKHVARWKDKSSNHLHFNAPDGGAPPLLQTSAINNKPAIKFTQANKEYLEGPGVQNLLTTADAFIVLDAFRIVPADASAGESYGLWGFSIYPSSHPVVTMAKGVRLEESFGVPTHATIETFDTRAMARPHLYGITTGLKWRIWLNASSIYETGGHVAFPQDRVLLGNTFGAPSLAVPNPFFNGVIAEVIIYDRELTPEERHTVNVYLVEKWAINFPDGGRP